MGDKACFLCVNRSSPMSRTIPQLDHAFSLHAVLGDSFQGPRCQLQGYVDGVAVLGGGVQLFFFFPDQV